MTLSAELHACAALVEAGDRERFAATMAAPPGVRPALWPIYAFNLEVARAPYASAEPIVAEMRLQWWADQIGRIGQGGRGEGEVAAALAPHLARVPALLPLLSGIIEARRRDCWREPFADEGDFLAYIDVTSGALTWAAALALGAPAGARAPVAAFGRGAGIAGWLAAVPALVAHGWTSLAGLAPETIAARARAGRLAIAEARQGRAGVPALARPALWAGWPARAHLDRAAADPGCVLAPGLPPPSRLAEAGALLRRAAFGYW